MSDEIPDLSQPQPHWAVDMAISTTAERVAEHLERMDVSHALAVLLRVTSDYIVRGSKPGQALPLLAAVQDQLEVMVLDGIPAEGRA